MTRRDPDILERAVHAVAEQPKNASVIVNEAHNAGLDRPSRHATREDAAP